MKAPPITTGPWAAQYDNPCCVIPGHTIKANDICKTPIGIVCKGTGASPKGIKEQKANARAIAALPEVLGTLADCVLSMEGLLAALKQKPEDNETLVAAKAALIKAGYTF